MRKTMAENRGDCLVTFEDNLTFMKFKFFYLAGLNSVTPAKHLALPNNDGVRNAVITARIAAHIGSRYTP
jgi:hypothetical protein